MSDGLNIRIGQAKRLAQARRAAGYRTPAQAIAKFGWKGSTYMAHENTQNGLRPGPAMRYAKAYGVDAGWLLTGAGPGPAPSEDLSVKADDENIRNPVTIKNEGVTDRTEKGPLSEEKIRVLGMAECGPDGWAVWNGEIVDWVPRPANLAGAKDAYAVFIIGDSMESRYHPGEIAFIHPKKPITPGAYVLVQRKPKQDGDSPLAVIKRLVKRTGDRVILEQLNPHKLITVQIGDIVSIHRVVGSVEA